MEKVDLTDDLIGACQGVGTKERYHHHGRYQSGNSCLSLIRSVEMSHPSTTKLGVGWDLNCVLRHSSNVEVLRISNLIGVGGDKKLFQSYIFALCPGPGTRDFDKSSGSSFAV
jgi:hypothetical protein